MSQSISNSGSFPLRSGNEIRWYRDDIGSRGAIRAEFAREPSHADKKEAMRYLETLVPNGATLATGEVNGSQRTKSLVDAFLGRGSSN